MRVQEIVFQNFFGCAYLICEPLIFPQVQKGFFQAANLPKIAVTRSTVNTWLPDYEMPWHNCLKFKIWPSSCL